MKVIIEQDIIEKFHPCVGVIYAMDIDNSVEVPEIDTLFQEASVDLKKVFEAYENVGEHPTIKAWREAYKHFGTDPKRYRSSIESLVRRVLKGESLPRINTLVDLYNYISIKYVLPVGGENSTEVKGDMRLAFATGTEEFIVLGGSLSESPDAGEVVYVDDAGIICRRWNWREADRTKLTQETTSAVIVIDAISPTERNAVERATQELAELIRKYCGGEVSVELLS